MTSNGIRLLLADVDGTLVTHHELLTDRSIDAVRDLRAADILFAITSGRPPRGVQMLIEPLSLDTPIAAFNGGHVVDADMSVVGEELVPAPAVPSIVAMLESSGLHAWIYRGADWLVRDAHALHVARESSTVRFEPTSVPSFDGIAAGVAKIVGVSNDHQLVASVASVAHDIFGDHVSGARSQPYYLDVTHPKANKGAVAKLLSVRYGIPSEQIATIGDMPNDVLMFAHSGLSIAMSQSGRRGAARDELKRRGWVRRRGAALRARRT
jgi:Cof subfamily protein (haloacid dehalogenase superfamily)